MFRNSTIKSIRPIGEEVVYDITVSEDASYIGNGFVNHNSSDSPNLQNLVSRSHIKDPKIKEAIKSVKQAFVPIYGDSYSDEYIIMEVDFQRMELALIANYSGCKELRKAMKSGDIHTITAAAIKDITLEKFMELKGVNEKEFGRLRTDGKIVNFATIYDISPKGLSDFFTASTGESPELDECEAMIKGYFKKYSGLRKWHKRERRYAKKHEFTRTGFGSRRRYPEINTTESKYFLGKYNRQAVNSNIQGTSGIMTIWLLTVLDKVMPREMGRIFNTIHDSVFLYINPKYLGYVCSLLDFIVSKDSFAQQFFHIHDDVKDFFYEPQKLDYAISDKNWSSIEEIEIKEFLNKYDNYFA